MAGDKAHRYVASTGNQRIECWWSSLRRSRTSWWINFFKNLSGKTALPTITNAGGFNEILQKDFDFFIIHWNTHYIRQSRHDTVGLNLFFLPVHFGGEYQIQAVTDEQVAVIATHCKEVTEDSDFISYFNYVIVTQQLAKPITWREALDLFNNLLTFAD